MRQNTQAYAARTGFLLTGINNMENAAAPSIQEGTVFEMNGALYKTAANEGAGGNLANGKCYLYAVPNTGGASFQYSVTPPVWNTAKGGWYNGNNRAVLRFDYANGAYNDKVLMDEIDYDAILKVLALLKQMKEEFDEALEEALKKMAGFDIPPDNAARTLVYSKTTQGEGSVTLGEGIYEVRMRGGKGGAGGAKSSSGSAGSPGSDGGTLNGFFKITGGNRVVYVDVGGAGGNGNAGDIQGRGGAGGYGGGAGGGGGGYGGSGNSGQEGGNGNSLRSARCPVRSCGIGAGGVGGRTSSINQSRINGGTGHIGISGGSGGAGGYSGAYSGAGNDNYYLGGGGGGGGGSSGISETLLLGGGRAPAGSDGAVEIYKVAV
jgi:hypothetical protein